MPSTSNGFITQWGWAEMEELLQCPICFDAPIVGIIEQCGMGHHICSECKKKVENCPLCKSRYPGTRNFVVEELMRHFEVLKNTMLLTAITQESKPPVIKEKKIKPEVVFCPSVFIVKTIPPTAAPAKGQYPCVIKNCGINLPSCRLLNHVRSNHSNILTEAVLNSSDLYTATWSLNSFTKTCIQKWQQALFIKGIGLVYFTYDLLKMGYAVMYVQMAAPLKVAENYKAKITVSNRSVQYSNTIRLISSREKFQNILYKDACLILDRTIMREVTENKKITCILELSPIRGNDRFGNNFFPTSRNEFAGIVSYYKANANK